MKRWLSILAGIVCTTLVLIGCGRTAGQMEPESSERQTEGLDEDSLTKEDFEKEFRAKESFDPLEEVWAQTEELAKASRNWSVVAFYDNILAGEQGFSPLFGCKTKVDYPKVYAMGIYVPDIGDADYQTLLTWFDVNTKESGIFPCESFHAAEGCSYYFVDFDCSGEQKKVFYLEFGEGKENRLYAITLGENGGFLEQTDLWPIFKEKTNLSSTPNAFGGKFFCEGEGYDFLYHTEKELFHITKDGDVISASDFLGEGDYQFTLVSRSGKNIFLASDNKDRTNIYFTFEENGIRELHREKADYQEGLFVNPYGELYSIQKGIQLVCRDLGAGKNETCYIGNTDSFADLVALVQNDKGEVLCIKEENIGSYSANVYLPVGIERAVTIQLYSDTLLGSIEQSAVTEYQRRHPGVKIQVQESTYEERENDWVKISSDLAKEEGPDILLLSRERMMGLAQDGILKNLAEVIPEDIQKEIFTGVWEYGVVDETLYGLTFTGQPNAYFVSDEIWEEDYWSLQDVVKLLQQKEAEGKPYTAFCNDWDYEPGLSARAMLGVLLGDIADSPFMNVQEGTCSFDSAAFIELLELCKAYDPHAEEATNVHISENMKMEIYMCVRDGELLTYNCIINKNLEGFSEAMQKLGERFHPVGYPSESGAGFYFDCYKTACVRQGVENEDVIFDFLRTLYSPEFQESVSSVRKDLLRRGVKKMDDDGQYYFNQSGSRVYVPLATKENGETYLEEYIAFCDKCRYRTKEWEKVEEIIDEEVDAYFYGDKSAEAVAAIIQSRVTLYLAEQI